MHYLIDFENVAQNGLEGLSELQETDGVILFYSAKNNNVSLTLTEIIRKLKAEYTLMCSEKTVQNYMDFWIVCECSRLFFKENKEDLTIISKDKGFISVKDYFKNMGKTIFLNSSIKEALDRQNKVEENDKVEGTKDTFIPKNLEKQEKTIFSKKVLSSADKEIIRDLLKEFPKKNGELHQTVYLAIENETKLGNYHFRLSSEFPNAILGTRVFEATKDFFCEFHNIQKKDFKKKVNGNNKKRK